MRLALCALLLAATLAHGADVALRWDPPATGGPVLGYRVYEFRATPDDGFLAGVTTNTFFLRTNLTAGFYRWHVTAFNAWGEGPRSNTISTNGLAPGAPVNLNLKAGDTVIINIR